VVIWEKNLETLVESINLKKLKEKYEKKRKKRKIIDDDDETEENKA